MGLMGEFDCCDFSFLHEADTVAFPPWNQGRDAADESLDDMIIRLECPVTEACPRDVAQSADWTSQDPEESGHIWAARYTMVSRFIQLFGRLPEVYTPDGQEHDRLMSRWIRKQREEYRNNTLDLYRQLVLDQLPGWAWE